MRKSEKKGLTNGTEVGIITHVRRERAARILENDTETKIEDKKEQSDFEELNALTRVESA